MSEMTQTCARCKLPLTVKIGSWDHPTQMILLMQQLVAAHLQVCR